MMKLIIIEGPDGSGKSTLARELQRVYKYRVWHEGLPPDQVKSFSQMFLHYARRLERTARCSRSVFDRLYHGERIYGPVMRRRAKLSALGEQLLDWRVDSLGGVVVICLPPYRYAFNTWVKRLPQEYVKHQRQFFTIYQQYWQLHTKLLRARLPVRLWDYTLVTATEMVRRLADDLSAPFSPVLLGARTPQFLVVGERVRAQPDIPFYSVTGSSQFLHGCLHEAGYSVDEVAFTNARTITGAATNLDKIWRGYSPRPVIIALGRVAAAACRSVNDDIVTLDHPQYVKRFKTTARAEYVRALAEVRRNR